jgi:hypothetical protein
MCKIIDGFPANADILEKVFAAASLYYNYTGDQTCNHIGDEDSPRSLDLSYWLWQVYINNKLKDKLSTSKMLVTTLRPEIVTYSCVGLHRDDHADVILKREHVPTIHLQLRGLVQHLFPVVRGSAHATLDHH